MPFESASQRGKCYALKAQGRAGSWDCDEWSTHTPKRLPKHKKGFDMHAIEKLAEAAAEAPFVEKLASDMETGVGVVRTLAAHVGMSPIAFVKLAYADPAAYVQFLGLATGAAKPTPESIKKAGHWGGVFRKMAVSLAGLVGRGVDKAVGGVGNALKATVGKGSAQGGFFGKSEPTSTLGKILGAAPTGGSRFGRAVATPLAVGGAYGTYRAATGSNSPPADAAGAVAAAPAPAPAGENPGTALGGAGGESAANPLGQGGASKGKMSQALKLLLLGGVGAGGLIGGRQIMKRRRRDKQAGDAFGSALCRLLVKKAAVGLRKEAAAALVSHLDGIVAKMPLEKTAQVRALQSEIAAGKPLGHAIKVAYPHLSGEQRGVLAATLVRSANSKSAFGKQAFVFEGGLIGGAAGGIAGARRGNIPEGVGRGVIRGAGTGLGASLGGAVGMGGGALLGALAQMLAAKRGDKVPMETALALGMGAGGGIGALGGGIGGYKLTGKMLGKPYSEREEKEKKASVLAGYQGSQMGKVPTVTRQSTTVPMGDAAETLKKMSFALA